FTWSGTLPDWPALVVRLVRLVRAAWSAWFWSAYLAGRASHGEPVRHARGPRAGTVPGRSCRYGLGQQTDCRLPDGPWLVRLRYAVVRVASWRGPDHPGEQFVRAHQGDRGPGCRGRADQAVGPALGHVDGERGGDAQREHPAGQPRDRQPVPGGVQDDHRGR